MADPEAAARGTDRRGRQLGLVAVLAVAGAALAAAAAALTWWTAQYVDPLTGALTVTASGATCVPELIPLALVSLAGFGAALATRGVLRRIVGAVIALCGIAVAVRSAMLFGSTPAALVGDLTRPADPVGAAQLHPFGPALGVLAGLLLAGAGVLVLIGIGARQAMGSRYERRGTRALTRQGPVADGSTTSDRVSGVGSATVSEESAAQDQGDWWKALDAGDDPTANSTPDSADGTPPSVSEPTSGDGYHKPSAGPGPG